MMNDTDKIDEVELIVSMENGTTPEQIADYIKKIREANIPAKSLHVRIDYDLRKYF